MRGSVLLISLLFWSQELGQSVRIVELRVPAHAAAGGEALLGCQFELEGDLLYSVKWLKDGREFYRYIPRNEPQARRFNAPGVSVDMSRSSSDVVTLVGLKPESAGVYRCEVSGEKPSFTTAIDEKYITIHILPQSGPRITGLRFQYDIGDRLIANCTIPGSKPEAQLKWMVNRRPASRGYIRGPWRSVAADPPDTTETTLGLNFMVVPSHFKTGVLEIKCQATIAPLYQREKVYVLSQPDPTEEPPSDPEPEPSEPSIDEEEIKEELIDSFRELANTLHLEAPAHVPSRSDLMEGAPSIPTTQATDKDNASSVEKSLVIMLVTLLVQVILL